MRKPQATIKTISWLLVLVTAFASCNSASVDQNDDLIVDAGPLGKIEGTRMKALLPQNRTYLGFLGLKYSQQPERFKVIKI